MRAQLSLLFLLLLFQGLDVDDVLHLVEVLVDIMHLSIQQLCQLLYLCFTIDGLLSFQVFLALKVEGSIDGEPVQFAAFVLIEYVSFYACQVAQLAFFDVDQELHIVPYHMVLLFVFLKAVLLTIQDVPFNPADEAKTVLILLQALLLLTDLCEFVDDDSADDLVHNHLNDEQIAEVYQDVPEGDSGKVVAEISAVVETHEASVCLEADAECEDEAIVESLAVGCVIATSIVEVKYGSEDVSQDEVDQQDHAELIHRLFDGFEDNEEGLASSEQLQHQYQRIEERVEDAQNGQQHGEEVMQIVQILHKQGDDNLELLQLLHIRVQNPRYCLSHVHSSAYLQVKKGPAQHDNNKESGSPKRLKDGEVSIREEDAVEGEILNEGKRVRRVYDEIEQYEKESEKEDTVTIGIV